MRTLQVSSGGVLVLYLAGGTCSHGEAGKRLERSSVMHAYIVSLFQRRDDATKHFGFLSKMLWTGATHSLCYEQEGPLSWEQVEGVDMYM